MEKKVEIKNVENLIYYDAIFIAKSWRIGTKNDPKKEYGLIKFNVEVPLSKPDANGETTFVQTIEEFVFDKANFPVEHLERYSKIKVAYIPPVCNPQGKLKFVKIVL